MIHYPNMLIIRGTGRNIGKTQSACRIIRNLAANHQPVGVKISSHFHPLSDGMEVLIRTENYVVSQEKSTTDKDSSRMLQSGASRAYYIQSRNEHVMEAYRQLLPRMDSSQPVVVESGGLYDFAEPAILVQIVGGTTDKNSYVRPETARIILASEEAVNNSWESVRFVNGNFKQDA